jgi:hypothetical protein
MCVIVTGQNLPTALYTPKHMQAYKSCHTLTLPCHRILTNQRIIADKVLLRDLTYSKPFCLEQHLSDLQVVMFAYTYYNLQWTQTVGFLILPPRPR